MESHRKRKKKEKEKDVFGLSTMVVRLLEIYICILEILYIYSKLSEGKASFTYPQIVYHSSSN